MIPKEADRETDHAFLTGGGELGERIGTFDWASTPIGPIDGWAPSLRNTVALILRNPVPIVLLWGEDGIMLYNDAYAEFAGARDAGLLGSRVREGWGEVADFNDNVMKVCLSGGTLSYKQQELTLNRHGRPEQAWMDLDYAPVLGEDGKPAGVIAIVVETTEAHRARDALAASEAQLRFLDSLSREIGTARDADDILEITTRLTAEYLGVSSCAYADMDPDEDGFTVRGDWAGPGSVSIVDHYSLASFGTRTVSELNAGRPLIVNDVAAELAPHEAEAFRKIDIAATICMPLVREGRLIALMAIQDRLPRAWSDHEITIAKEVTERSWAHIERVRAEQQLAEREVHTRQILDSAIDYAIISIDRDGRVVGWNAGADRILGWTETEMRGQSLDRFFTPEDRALDRAGSEMREASASGRSSADGWRLRKSGERFWAHGEMTPLRDDAGATVGFVKVLRDRTEEYRTQDELRTSEALLRRSQEAGGVGLFSIEIASNDIIGTPEFFRIFGLEPRERLPAGAIERLVIAEDVFIVSDVARREAGTAPLDVEYRIHRADTGEERIIARKGEYERAEDGSVIRLVGAVQDVTERRGVQRALERSEARFSALARFMPNQVWTARADGTLDWFNDQVYAYRGIERSKLVIPDWVAMLHVDDQAETQERWDQALQSGDTYETQFRLLDKHGNYRWHLARAVPLRDLQGVIVSWIGTNTDIDSQKRTEAAYANDRDRLWTLSQDLMLVSTFEGVITAVNPSAMRLLGWTEAEMTGSVLTDFLHPDDVSQSADEVAKLAKGATTLNFVNRYRTKSGDYRLLDWTAVPDDGRIHGVGRDITNQRATEEALRQSQKMEAVGQLTGGIAHDFNNLLQGITGSLDIMEARLRQGRANDLERWLTGAKTSANRAAALTHRLLAFSRRQPLDPRPVRANPLISSMEDMLRRTLGERIDLELVLAGGLWLTRCDPNQLESAILNLAINARDAMADGGKLVIETCNAHLDSLYAARERDVRPGQYVCICVTDSGTGMSKDVVSRAFEPFFTTKPMGQGTGLGLSMIYGFTRQSEGYCRIYSEVGEGSTIKLYLPRHRGDEDPEDILPTLAEAPAAEGEVVLVVEDEPVVRGLIVEVLGELGYRAIEAEDGPKGLEILQSRRRIDLLITDIGLPGLNGRQVADAGRVSRPDLKILFMTGYAENAALASGFLEPGMAMITKPFAMEALATRIRDIIEGR